MEVRQAMMKDLKLIQELNLRLFKKEHKEYDPMLNLDWTMSKPGKKFFTERIKNGFVTVAEADGKIIGYLTGGEVNDCPYRLTKNTAELENMFVLDEHRNQKIGTKLVEAFLAWCKKRGYEHIKVASDVHNESAIRFYRKFGFKDYTLILEKF